MVLDLSAFGTVQVRKENILDGAAFLLHGVFSPEECRSLIEQSEEHDYQPLHHRFRTNDRTIVQDSALAELCMERIRPFLPRTISIDPKHTDLLWGNRGWAKPKAEPIRTCAQSFDAGKWQVADMSPHWRFCRYTQGGFFRPHSDACHVESPLRRSILTVNVYLNDCDGGATRLLHDYRQHSPEDASAVQQAGKGDLTSYCDVQPRAGTALVFVHWLWHEGAPLGSGMKYLLRSDVMYERTQQPKPPGMAFAFREMASEAEGEGKTKIASSLYRQAIKQYPAIEPFL
jgi:hypothetical protein